MGIRTISEYLVFSWHMKLHMYFFSLKFSLDKNVHYTLMIHQLGLSHIKFQSNSFDETEKFTILICESLRLWLLNFFLVEVEGMSEGCNRGVIGKSHVFTGVLT